MKSEDLSFAKMNIANDLINFLNASPTAFHATHTLRQRFEKAGYQYLDEGASWKLEPGGAYFVERNGSGLMTFRCGKEAPQDGGFRIFGAHTDSPGLKVKLRSETNVGNSTILRVEKYGGPILATWVDRELTLAGRVISCSTDGALVESLVDLHRPVAVIPNLAIHFNREVNTGFEYNPHTHLAPLLTVESEPGQSVLLGLLAQHLNIEPQTILDADLFLCDTAPARLTGASGEFIISGRLDNLAMCHAILTALLEVTQPHCTTVGLFFDNEEVGSETMQGASSAFARDVLERVVLAFGGGREESMRALSRSFIVSADMAHAVHPNFVEKHDPTYAPVINGGPVIKENANQRYVTTGRTAARFAAFCANAEVPFQRLANRADAGTGGTIGPQLSRFLGTPGVDVGSPMYAMHSIRETAGVRDPAYMVRALVQVCLESVL